MWLLIQVGICVHVFLLLVNVLLYEAARGYLINAALIRQLGGPLGRIGDQHTFWETNALLRKPTHYLHQVAFLDKKRLH